ncbi:NlpC/P60 family protein [Embleya sp. NPDC005971]|uniref:C40 family peptidase n=1 Tax=Embleya sp. NPDC005971 TaxID=3156724 RepID=UPI0033DED2C6
MGLDFAPRPAGSGIGGGVAGRRGCGCAVVAVPGAFLGALILVATTVLGGDGSGSAAAAGFDGSAAPAAYRDVIASAGRMCPPVLSPAILAAQLEQESGFDPRALSEVGAMGIAQFMPGTWPNWGRDENGDGKADPYDPQDAIPAAARYDCALAREVQGYVSAGQARGDITDLMLAAYNAGPGRIKEFGGIPPYRQTQEYVPRIRALAKKYEALGVPVSAGQGAFGKVVAESSVQWLGTPYSWGGGTASGPSEGFGSGAGINGFDCSGLVIFVIAKASGGKQILPHSSQIQVTMGQPVNRNQMLPGDIIGFAFNGSGDYSHIGVYMGGGQMVHAPKPGDHVKVSNLNDQYYSSASWLVRRFG